MLKMPLIKHIGNGMRIIMNIINRALTLNQNVANQTIECIAGCRVTLTLEELAGLANPFNPGFTLSCVLLAGDPGPDPVIFTFPLVQNRVFRTPADITFPDHVFRATVGVGILNEDTSGADEIKARFTFVNNANGAAMTRRSPRITIVL